MEKPPEAAGFGPSGWVGQVPENLRGGANRWVETPRSLTPVPVGAGAGPSEGTTEHFRLEESCLPALSLTQGTPRSLLCVPVSCKLLLPGWSSDAVTQSKSVRGTFKRNSLGLQKPSVSHSLDPRWFLQPGVWGTSLAGTGTLGWGPPSFYLPPVDVGPAHSSSPPLLAVSVWLLQTPRSGTSMQLDFRGPERRFSCSFLAV